MTYSARISRQVEIVHSNALVPNRANGTNNARTSVAECRLDGLGKLLTSFAAKLSLRYDNKCNHTRRPGRYMKLPIPAHLSPTSAGREWLPSRLVIHHGSISWRSMMPRTLWRTSRMGRYRILLHAHQLEPTSEDYGHKRAQPCVRERTQFPEACA